MREATYETTRGLLDLPAADQDAVLRRLTARDLVQIGEAARTDWGTIARPKQRLPAGKWRWCVFLAGRSWGKTRAGAEAVREAAESGEHEWITIVAPTANNLLRDMLGGPSGLITISPRWFSPEYLVQRNELRYPRHPISGIRTRVALLSADKPDRIRGSQCSFLWGDEPQSWSKAQDAFDMADLSLRLGPAPRGVITMTPKPTRFVRDLILGPRDQTGRRTRRSDLVVVKGSTFENVAIAADVLESLRQTYSGTSRGRQELEAEILEAPEGALWTQDIIDKFRLPGLTVPPTRFVVGVDPSRSSTGSGDACGIIVACRTPDGHIYVMEDATCHAGPQVWAMKAAALANKYQCDVTYETNRIAEDMAATLRQVAGATGTRWNGITSSETKAVRAAPVALLYEAGFVHHVGGDLEFLETEMCSWDSTDPKQPSPNRVDALVHTITELGPGKSKPPLIAR